MVTVWSLAPFIEGSYEMPERWKNQKKYYYEEPKKPKPKKKI
jgi:hypothetical protein